jgi:hypothetical protein
MNGMNEQDIRITLEDAEMQFPEGVQCQDCEQENDEFTEGVENISGLSEIKRGFVTFECITCGCKFNITIEN